ncbi:MAG: hypothetical protein PHZ00_07535 [Candidatus Peribacteraceae bacterium]|nr:hypothetical protein [Candidatus Peribacteraceae bacterium]
MSEATGKMEPTTGIESAFALRGFGRQAGDPRFTIPLLPALSEPAGESKDTSHGSRDCRGQLSWNQYWSRRPELNR